MLHIVDDYISDLEIFNADSSRIDRDSFLAGIKMNTLLEEKMMGIIMRIRNTKNIDEFEFEIPIETGLYALTGENGSGKSTVISCAATSFYVPSLYAYFGEPKEGSAINFYFGKKNRRIWAERGHWCKPIGSLGITGFYEGSIVFGNRFKDVDYSSINKLANIDRSGLEEASKFVKQALGNILHDDEAYYDKLWC